MGDVLAWGDNTSSQLGIQDAGSGMMWKSVDRPRVVEVLRGTKVTKVHPLAPAPFALPCIPFAPARSSAGRLWRRTLGGDH